MTNTKNQKDFAAERAANGTVQDLFRVVRPADIRISEKAYGEVKVKGRMVYLPVAHYDKETGKTTFLVMSEFIDPDKKCAYLVEKFYTSLEKGQLLFIEYKVSEKSNTILSISKREDKKAKAPTAVVVDAEL